MTSTKKKLNNEILTKKVIFTAHAWEDYQYWIGQDDMKKVKRIHELIDAAKQSPLGGIGKPERLSGNLKGFYSRRIDVNHRLVYKYIDSNLVIVMARHHY